MPKYEFVFIGGAYDGIVLLTDASDPNEAALAEEYAELVEGCGGDVTLPVDDPQFVKLVDEGRTEEAMKLENRFHLYQVEKQQPGPDRISLYCRYLEPSEFHRQDNRRILVEFEGGPMDAEREVSQTGRLQEQGAVNRAVRHFIMTDRGCVGATFWVPVAGVGPHDPTGRVPNRAGRARYEVIEHVENEQGTEIRLRCRFVGYDK